MMEENNNIFLDGVDALMYLVNQFTKNIPQQLILVVEKTTLFAHTFFDEISMDKNSILVLTKLQANENIRGAFALVTLKS